MLRSNKVLDDDDHDSDDVDDRYITFIVIGNNKRNLLLSFYLKLCTGN